MWEVWRMKRRRRRTFWWGRRSSPDGRRERAPWNAWEGSRLWVGGPLCRGSRKALRKEETSTLHFTSYTLSISNFSFLRGPIGLRRCLLTRAKRFSTFISPPLRSTAFYLLAVLYFSRDFLWISLCTLKTKQPVFFFFPLQLSRSRMQIILSRLSKKSEEDEKERVLNVRWRCLLWMFAVTEDVCFVTLNESDI